MSHRCACGAVKDSAAPCCLLCNRDAYDRHSKRTPHGDARRDVNQFLTDATRGYACPLWDLQDGPIMVRVRYRNRDDTATETVVAVNWSEMLAKLQERFR